MSNETLIRALLGRPKLAAADDPTAACPPEGGYRTSPPIPTDPVSEHDRTLADLMTNRDRPDASAERTSIEDFASSNTD
jgi:hypothetical protein